MFAGTTRILLFLLYATPLLSFQTRRSPWNTARTAAAWSALSSGAKNDMKAVVEDELLSVVGDLDCEATPDSSQLYQALQDRLSGMEQGIGKRYVCRTQRGFLNIHKEPGDPYHTHNIVGQLRQGDIVTSTGPNRGAWIRHDGGGWSISIFGGFTWLEELRE